MSSVNKVILIGNLGNDPDMHETKSGDAVANFSLATSFKTGDDEKTEWHRVVMFAKLGQLAGEYLKKGSKVYVEGRLQTRKYDDKDGVTRYTTEIVGERMQFLSAKVEEDDRPEPTPAKKAAPKKRTSRKEEPQDDEDLAF